MVTATAHPLHTIPGLTGRQAGIQMGTYVPGDASDEEDWGSVR